MLKQVLNSSLTFFKTAKNFTKDVDPEKDIFTPVEIETLSNVIASTEKWLNDEIEAQNALPRNEPVRLTVKLISEKMNTVDREMKYLVNKLKIWKPKILQDSLKKLKDLKDLNATKVEKDEGGEEIQMDSEEQTIDQPESSSDFKEAPETEENIIEATETVNEDVEAPHSEL